MKAIAKKQENKVYTKDSALGHLVLTENLLGM